MAYQSFGMSGVCIAEDEDWSLKAWGPLSQAKETTYDAVVTPEAAKCLRRA